MKRPTSALALCVLFVLSSCDEPALPADADAGRASTEDGGAGTPDAATVSGGTEPNDGDDVTTLVFVNGCDGVLEIRGSDIEPASIAPGERARRDIGDATETLSSKRYWAFIGEDPGGGRYTLAEFTFNTDFNDFDWYNISHVDAHNLTMRISPLARPGCDELVCDSADLLSGCPEVGRYEDALGALVSCVSPERDDSGSPVALHFESCDDGYAWSGDDASGDDPSPVRACAGEDWEIELCP